jgi:hypothetical protein
MKDNKRDKAVRLSEGSHGKLKEVANRLGLDHKAAVEAMIHYFFVVKTDPRNLTEANPAHAINDLKNTVISFFKVHESKKLQPILKNLETLSLEISEQHNELVTKSWFKDYLARYQRRG